MVQDYMQTGYQRDQRRNVSSRDGTDMSTTYLVVADKGRWRKREALSDGVRAGQLTLPFMFI
jgi:hypothetical protein